MARIDDRPRVSQGTAGNSPTVPVRTSGSEIVPAPRGQADAFDRPARAGLHGGPNEVAPVPRRSLTDLQAQARAAQENVFQAAVRMAATDDPEQARALEPALTSAYAGWRESVVSLVRRGAVATPEVKAYTVAVQQAALLHASLPPEALSRRGASFRSTAEEHAQKLFAAPLEALIPANPLLVVPPLLRPSNAERAAARGVPLVDVTLDGEPARVRSDVVMVFAPGVARTGEEFIGHQKAAREAGIASVVADTGTFQHPSMNAEDVNDAVQKAKSLVQNPDARVVLVGYSQGATNVLSYLRDEDGRFADTRDDVVGIHLLHSAARGSDVAEMIFAVGRYLFTEAEPTPRDMTLIRAALKAKNALLPRPLQNDWVDDRLLGLRATFRLARRALASLVQTASRTGLHLDRRQLYKALVTWMQEKENVAELVPAFAEGRVARFEAGWDELRAALKHALAQNPDANPLIHAYVHGGLKSLTTEGAQQLLEDPKLQESLRSIPILNSVAEIPESRVADLVPKPNRFNHLFFTELGLAHDCQVPVERQRLESVLPTAIDLAPQAVGHWAGAGIMVGQKVALPFAPEVVTHSALASFSELGIL